MGRGSRTSTDINVRRKPAAASRSALWTRFFDEAIASGSPLNAARFIASERLAEAEAAADGRSRPGQRDFDCF